MILKIFRGVWFLSLLAVFVNLLYVYAGFSGNVTIYEDSNSLGELSKDTFFYIAITMIALVNVLVYLMAKFFAKAENFRAWFHGLIITLNIFFIIAFSFIGLFNSSERFDYGRAGIVVYGSLILFVLWALSWPFYSVYRKISSKQTV